MIGILLLLEWFESADSPSNDTVETPRVSNISCLSTEDPVPDTPRSKIRSDDTDFVKLAKTGGHKGKGFLSLLIDSWWLWWWWLSSTSN